MNIILLQCTNEMDIHQVDSFDENTVEVTQMEFLSKIDSIPKGTVLGCKATEEFLDIMNCRFGVKML